MAGVSLEGISNVDTPTPTAGTEGRSSPIPSPLAGFLKGVAEVGTGLLKDKKDDAADQALAAEQVGLIDTARKILQGPEDTKFLETPVDKATQGAVQDAEKALGAPVTEEQRAALTAAAVESTRLRQVAKQNPSKQTQVEIAIAESMRRLLVKHPELAQDFQGLFYGKDSFITQLAASEEQTAAAAAQKEAEQKAKDSTYLRRKAIDAGYIEAINVPDDQLLPYMETIGMGRAMREVHRSTEKARTLEAQAKTRGFVDDAALKDTAEASYGARSVLLMANLEGILNDPSLGPPGSVERQRAQIAALEKEVGAARKALSEAFPSWARTGKLEEQFKGLLVDAPERYRSIIMGTPEREVNEAFNAASKAAFEADITTQYPTLQFDKFILETMEPIARVMGPNWVVENFKVVRGVAHSFLKMAAADATGQPPPPPPATRDDDKAIVVREGDKVVFSTDLARKFSSLPPAAQKATVQIIVDGLAHPDNNRTEAGLDVWMKAIASPDFEGVVSSPEFKEAFNKSNGQRAFESYLAGLGRAAGTTLVGARQKVDAKMGSDGLMMLVPGPGVSKDDAEKVRQLNQRLRFMLIADSRVNGRTLEESSINLWEKYIDPEGKE